MRLPGPRLLPARPRSESEIEESLKAEEQEYAERDADANFRLYYPGKAARGAEREGIFERNDLIEGVGCRNGGVGGGGGGGKGERQGGNPGVFTPRAVLWTD